MPQDIRSVTRREALRLLGVAATAVTTGASHASGPLNVGEMTRKVSSRGSQDSMGLASDLTTAANIADMVRARKVSAAEVLQAHLKRIETANLELNAFVYLDVKAARQAAQSIDDRIQHGEDPGALAGVPIGVKDLHDCAGMPTSLGSLLHKGGPPAATDSPLVARARRAGAVMVGKTATPEFGWLSITASKAWGVTRNPWNLGLSPGGSSGGSAAAIAAGMVPLASGTDIGGSIRSPAAFTGLVGLKPSFGRIGQPILDDMQVNGCLTLDVKDTARFLDVAAGPEPFDRTSLPYTNESYERLIETLNVTGLRAVWSPDLGFIPTERECADVARRAAESLVRAAKMVWIDHDVNFANVWELSVSPAVARFRGELELDGFWPSKVDQLTDEVRSDLATIGSLRCVDLARAERARHDLDVQTANLFTAADVLLTPVTAVVMLPAEGPVPTVIAGREARNTGAEAHLKLANLSWLPAISVPAGLSSSGFPIGLQIVCARWRDDVALRLARILELAQPWPHRAPAYRDDIFSPRKGIT